MSDEIDQLATALCAAQAEMGNAVFNRTNPHYKSKYADLASVRAAILPVLAKHGLSIAQYTIIPPDSLDGIVLCTRLMHKSGQSLTGGYPIPMGTPQQMGSHLSYARRYGLSSIAVIAAEEDDDANAAEGLMPTNARGQGAGKSKAASRSDYEELAAELRALESPKNMTEWWKENVDRINALPGEWIGFLKDAFTHRRDELRATTQTDNAKRRQEGKPYGVKEQLEASLAEDDAA